MYRVVSSLKSILLLLILLGSNSASTSESIASEAPLRVVTSFSILEDLVKELGGEFVSVVNLVGRNGDAHTYHPRPSDSIALANAELVVFNGLAFEGWMSRLINNSGYKNEQLIASHGVDVITHGEESDPHAWQSFHNIRFYVQNISRKLITMRPQHEAALIERQIRYSDALNALEQNLLEQIAAIPVKERIVVTSHDAFGYLGREFRIRFLAPLGLNVEVEASATDVAAVIDQIREQQVQALFLENITNPRILQRISAETGVAIGGRLYSDALSEVEGPANTYLHMMKYNVESLVKAFHLQGRIVESSDRS